MDTAGATQLIVAVFGAGGVTAAVGAGWKVYQASIDRAKKQARIELLQEQSAATIETLKAEGKICAEENAKWKALWEAGQIPAPRARKAT